MSIGMARNLQQSLLVLFNEKLRIHIKSVETIEAADDFAAELDMRFLVFADGNDEFGIRFAVHDDICRLQNRVSKESESVQVLILDVFERLLIGGYALEPAERRNHGEQQVQLGVL